MIISNHTSAQVDWCEEANKQAAAFIMHMVRLAMFIHEGRSHFYFYFILSLYPPGPAGACLSWDRDKNLQETCWISSVWVSKALQGRFKASVGAGYMCPYDNNGGDMKKCVWWSVAHILLSFYHCKGIGWCMKLLLAAGCNTSETFGFYCSFACCLYLCRFGLQVCLEASDTWFKKNLFLLLSLLIQEVIHLQPVKVAVESL